MCINTIRIVVHSLRKSDAVGNFVQAVAREAERRGWPYALYAEYCNLQINIAGNYKQLYQDLTSGDILLYHLTWGDPEFKLLMNVKCKKVVYYHNLTPGYFFLSDFPKIARELDSSREILPYISKADALFANSLYSLEDIAAYLKPGAVCGVMPPLTRAMLLKRFSHVDFSSPLFPSPYVLTLGRVAPHKNIEWGIRLFAEASSRHPDLSYVIAGSGGFEKYNEKLKKIILETDANADRIYWIDNVSDRDVACLIYHAEFLLHTSLHEGFGMPLLEAMAFDTPIYAVRQPAIEETLGNAGVLLSGEDLLADSSVLEEWFNSSNRGDNFSVLRKKRYDAITFAADHSIFWNEITPSPSSPEKDTFKREEVLKKQSNYRVKNIVLLCRQIKQFGGIPTFTRDLANALAALGNSVHIFAETSDDPKITKENNIFFHWLKVEDVPLPPIVSAKRVLPEHWAWSYAALRECRRLAKEKNIEIVEAPIWDCEGVAFLYDKTWPLVTSLHTVYYTHMQSYPHSLTLPGFEEQFVRPHLALERRYN